MASSHELQPVEPQPHALCGRKQFAPLVDSVLEIAGPPSEQQTAALEKLGILPDAVESAGKAALLLDRLNKRRDEGLTTPKQIRCLEKYGFQHVGTWSFEAARHMIDRIAAQGWRGVPKGVNPRTYTPVAEPPAADSPFDFGW